MLRLDTPVTTAAPTPETPVYTPPAALTTASPPSGKMITIQNPWQELSLFVTLP